MQQDYKKFINKFRCIFLSSRMKIRYILYKIHISKFLNSLDLVTFIFDNEVFFDFVKLFNI